MFLNDIHSVGKKMTINGRKLAKHKSCLFFKSPLFKKTFFKIAEKIAAIFDKCLKIRVLIDFAVIIASWSFVWAQ